MFQFKNCFQFWKQAKLQGWNYFSDNSQYLWKTGFLFFFFIEYPEDGNLSQEEDTEDYTETEEDELKGTEEEDEVESPKKEAKSKKRKASAVKGKGKAKVRAKSSWVTQTQM